MSKDINVSYVYKKNNDNSYRVIDFVKGRFDEDSEIFVASNGKLYRHILFSNKEGFGLRSNISSDLFDMYYERIINNAEFLNNNYFYLNFEDNSFYLYWVVNGKSIRCNDIDLDDFNIKYNKMCDDIIKNKKTSIMRRKGK